jgi:uncharacterized repeat protein (TIGR02543 family)
MKTKPTFLRTWKIASALLILSLVVAAPLFTVYGVPALSSKSDAGTTDTYVGSVKLNWAAPGVYTDTLTEPTGDLPDLGSIDLGFLANCSSGALSGNVDLSATLTFPEITSGKGPAIHGTCDGSALLIESDKFTQTINQVKDDNGNIIEAGQNVERQFRLIATALTPPTYTGKYRETVWGYGPTPITIEGDFELRQINAYTLNIKAENGTVTKNPDQATYRDGDVVTLTPTPDSGWHFFKWSGRLAGNDNPAQIVIHSDTTITAIFSDTYTLTYIPGANGTIGGNASQTVVPGADGTPVTAVPNAGYHFVKWSDDSTANPRTDTNIASDITVTATFDPDTTYTVTYDGNGSTGGTIPVDSGLYLSGATVTVLGNTGSLVKTNYTFAGWNTQADGLGTTYAPDATFTMGSANVTLYAKWTNTIYTKSIRSTGTLDGWILESGENTLKGGTMDVKATTLRLGDDVAKKQYRSILSFATGAALPDNAVITKVTLKLRRQGIVGGGNPVSLFKGFMVDIRKGIFGTSALQLTDWQTKPSKPYGPFNTAVAGGWYTIDLTVGKAYINPLVAYSGLTQVRLGFKIDDNNDGVANYLSLYSGNAPAASQPLLILQYFVP